MELYGYKLGREKPLYVKKWIYKSRCVFYLKYYLQLLCCNEYYRNLKKYLKIMFLSIDETKFTRIQNTGY